MKIINDNIVNIIHWDKIWSIGEKGLDHSNTIVAKTKALKHLCDEGPINPIIDYQNQS